MDAPILITGASGGLGSALTRYLLGQGWRNLVCHYRTSNADLEALLRRYDLDPARHTVQADLTDEQEVANMQRAVAASFGTLYGLVNLAGASSNAMSWKLAKADFQRILDANVVGTFLACRAFIPEMREARSGRIVNISSVVGHTGVAGAAHYCAAKAAVVGLSKALAVELAPRNVSVSIVSLGYFDYGLIHTVPAPQQEQIRSTIPAQRFGSEEEFGGLVKYLLTEAGQYATGQVYHLNGGLYS